MFDDRSSVRPHRETAPAAGGRSVGRSGGRIGARILICCGVGLGASGCSLSFPISGFTADTAATGSVTGPDALLFKALDQEDWRRAKAAMAVALDPQGNGTSVAWENPASGAKGSFVAAAEPVAAADTICRDFKAHMVAIPPSAREITGSACRSPEGGWLVRAAAEVKPARG